MKNPVVQEVPVVLAPRALQVVLGDLVHLPYPLVLPVQEIPPDPATLPVQEVLRVQGDLIGEVWRW